MREIKFRAWNTMINKMIKNVKEMGIFALAENCSIDEFLVIPTSKKYPLMQYTGLKDRNGVEIYSGDIIKFKYTSSDYKKAYIEWNEEKASYDFVDNETKLNYSYNFRQINNIEVIGNVYEHKHLIE